MWVTTTHVTERALSHRRNEVGRQWRVDTDSSGCTLGVSVNLLPAIVIGQLLSPVRRRGLITYLDEQLIPESLGVATAV